MALMSWSPAFSVKIKQCDDQHMKLVALVNELHDAMKQGKGKDVLDKVLNGLITYTATHFAAEEKLMALHSYPELEQHTAVHQALVKQVLELQEKFKSGQTMLTHSVMIFLKDWLVNHIQGDDKKYGVYLNSKGVV